MNRFRNDLDAIDDEVSTLPNAEDKGWTGAISAKRIVLVNFDIDLTHEGDAFTKPPPVVIRE